MNFLDTSILIAAARPSHKHHAACASLLRNASPASTAIGAHTLAETYTNLSGAFQPRPLSPRISIPLLEDYVRRVHVVSLNPAEYMQVIRQNALAGTTGDAIYDALLLGCARKVGAEKIYTLNIRDFRRVAPDLASIIVEP